MGVLAGDGILAAGSIEFAGSHSLTQMPGEGGGEGGREGGMV